MTFGEKLQTLRTGADLSQEDLAERLGVSRQSVSKWELDKTVPDVRYIVALSELFQVTTDYLLKDDPAPSSPPLPEVTAPRQQDTSPPARNRDNSPLLSVLLICGDIFLLALMLLRFFMLHFFSYRLSFIPLVLILFLAPVFLLFSRYCLSFPAQALLPLRHAGAACLTIWGCALAMVMDTYTSRLPGLWLSLQTGGELGFLLPLGLVVGSLAVLYFVCFRLIRRYTSPPSQ